MKEFAGKQKVQTRHSPGCLNLLIPLSCAALIVAHFVSSFFPAARLWGINHLAYFPLGFGVPLTLLCLLLVIPKINRRIQNWLRGLFDPVYKLTFGRSKNLWFVLFSLISFPVFWLFRTRTHFLGDSYQIIANLESGGFYVKWSGLGESLVHIYPYKLLNSLFNIDAGAFYELSSCFFGVIFIYLIFLLVDFLGEDKGEKLFLFLLVSFMGSIQLFCGYAENYSLTYVLLFGFVFSSLKYLKNRDKTFLPLLLFAVAVFSHISSSYLLPAVLVLYLLGYEKKEKSSFLVKRENWAFLFLILIALVIFFYVNKYSWTVGNKFVPLFQGDYYGPGYTLFSLPHILDVINQQLLISPVGLLLLIVAWICMRSFNLRDKSVLFLSVAFLLGMGFNLIMYPGLGMSRDWDMFSSTSVGYTVLAGYLLLKLAKRGIDFRYVSSVLVITTIFCTLPWVFLNTSEQKGVERFRHLMQLDPKKSRGGHYALAAYFDEKGLGVEVIREDQTQADAFPELELVDLGIKSFQKKDLDEAFRLGKRALEIEPTLAEAHLLLGRIYQIRGAHRQAETEYRLAIDLKPGQGRAYLNLGDLYVVRQAQDSALHYYEKAAALNVRYPSLFTNLGNLCALKGSFGEAIRSYKKALEIEPDFAEAYYGLGKVFFHQNKLDEAVPQFRKACEKKPDFGLAHYHLAYIYAQKGQKEEAERELKLFMDCAPDEKEAQAAKREIESLLKR